jgi:hypothetical protein
MIGALPRPTSADVAVAVAAHAAVTARLSEVRSLAAAASPAGMPSLPPRFLRHADEQTVLAVRAVLEAAVVSGLGAADPGSTFREDGVVAAPCQPGRPAAALTMINYASAGGGTVSPHVVPQCSLHSAAGAISVALGMHGPNVGVAGGSDVLREGLLAAATLHAILAAQGNSSGRVWLVMTAWDEEPSLDPAAKSLGDPTCRAIALATRQASGQGWAELTWSASGAAGPTETRAATVLVSLERALSAAGPWTWTCLDGGSVRLVPAAMPLRRAA